MRNRNLVNLLTRELDFAWNSVKNAIECLTENEFWWKPPKDAWTLRMDETRWILDYDIPESIPKGPLTIAWLTVHLATCKIMYVNYAFEAGQLTWDNLNLPSTLESALDYLKRSHVPLRNSIKNLDDSDLPITRKTNWGDLWTTERIIWTLIYHDIYHGAQIQVLRKIFQAQNS